jgi:DNA-binding transcriptional MerR regulator
MPRVLAVCDVCGSFFPTYGGEFYNGPEIDVIEATVTVGSDVQVPDCPNCGGTSHILGGEYNVVGDTLELLQGPERTVSQLERLAEILREARDQNASLEEIRQAVSEEASELGTLADLLPRNRAELYAFIALILTAIQLLLSSPENIQNTNVDIEKVINKTVEQHYRVGSTESLRQVPKVGRNEPCPCGSGKKYKRCHGDSLRVQQEPR